MPKEFSRNRRVAELIQRELATQIPKFILDKEIGLVTISGVDVSPDLKNAKVFVTAIGNTLSNDAVAARLNDHAGHFRQVLSRVIILRSMPRLQFVFDHSLEQASRLSALIDTLKTGENAE